jgi:hypothetical protein
MTAPKGAYLDRDHRPSEEEILAGLGPGRGLWEELNDLLERIYKAAKDLVFYGKSYG